MVVFHLKNRLTGYYIIIVRISYHQVININYRLSGCYEFLLCARILLYFWPMELEKIKNDLAAKVKSINPIGKKLNFRLDDEFIQIDGTGTENIVIDSDAEADCTITMSKETYLKIQRGEIKPMIATLTGKIKVKGDIGLAQRLKQLL